MKITNEMIEKAYMLSKMVYNHEIEKKTALEKLVQEYGMNRNSANDYINNFFKMMGGYLYTRTNNEYATEYYLEHISQDFGNEKLMLALQSVRDHVTYYESLGNGRLVSIRAIYMKYAKSINEASNNMYPDEMDDINYFEGAKKKIIVNAYERDPRVRDKNIEYYGYKCIVCQFSFEDVYGPALGTDFIHVHHLIPLSEVGESYQIDPIKDLRPVCPNCHAMLHRKKPAYSIDELKEIIRCNRR